MENIVEFKGVTKRFKGFSLENINLQIKQGYVTGFIGANGAGKSTTMKLMMNLLQADAGEIKVFGLDYASHEKEIKERIGFVYDSNVFYEGLNIKDIRQIVAPSYKNWSDEQFYDYIKKFELPLNKAVKTFSKGMQMKVSLAMALSHDAEFIMMDEPTAGLDPVFRRELLDILKDIMEGGKRTLFFSTHITSDLNHIANYITFIQKGKILFNDSMDEVQERYALVKGSTDLINRDTEKSFIKVEHSSTGFQALTDDVKRVKELFGDRVVIEEATLEDIMFYVKGASHQHV
ncbi:ABC transporter ATP-binding protein [Siminovitchia terrae]|uniref:ABC transporter ATP-binding protein n=1 Tax=Siminovitchia terrae TaxID=1914933 RepID=A0A429XAE7_SIMTE|nr:ABC transporter ATP-binding protein [Siminovitchia terrae]RST60376.1 ABC transporter ATP-binding protein [Siminovitchia terrae]GIN96882.1 ABC transporter ATP-binding protein [Siminovitchia terrae]